jgi:hypothetical protein
MILNLLNLEMQEIILFLKKNQCSFCYLEFHTIINLKVHIFYIQKIQDQVLMKFRIILIRIKVKIAVINLFLTLQKLTLLIKNKLKRELVQESMIINKILLENVIICNQINNGIDF